MKQDFLTKLYSRSYNSPLKIALVDSEFEINYRDLILKVEEKISDFKEYNFHQKIVALQLPRGIEFVVNVLALTKMGVTFIPQDINQPAVRLNKMLELSHANYVIKLENDVYSISKINDEDNTTDAWAIYFTSGSTGLPKAVEVSRENLENIVIWEKELFNLSSTDNFALFTAYSFAISYIELFSGLYAGSTLHILSEEVRHDFKLLEDYLRDHNITFMNTTASIGEYVIRKMKLPNLRVLTLSGQRFPNINLDKVNYSVYNVYGNTECGAATVAEITSSTEIITIGTPVKNMNVVTLDKNDVVQNSGEIGELFIFGPQVALGYYLDTEATEKAFINVKINGKIVHGYKSGDYGQILSDGKIKYLGRKDRQFKINGVRLDLSEIEYALKNILPNIQQSYICVRNDKIYCWIVQEEPVFENKIVRELEKKLPEIMIPNRIIGLDELPLNGNGKTDEQKLFRMMETGLIKDSRNISREEADMEDYLKHSWGEILGIPESDISYRSDFKKLGATSLQIMELGVKILDDLDKVVNFVELYNKSKLYEMSNLLLEGEKFKPIYTFVERSSEMNNVPPLFVIHSGNTGSDVYRPLFENISNPSFPIYIIEPYNLLRHGDRINGIENISRFYIDLIKSFSPEKDANVINLMGWSYGGVVASEMCYQLEGSSKQVGELTILDAPFYLEDEDYKLAIEREKNGYYRKYFENTHIFRGNNKLNLTTEHLIKNNHEVFKDLLDYTPKVIKHTDVKFVRSMVEKRPLTNRQILSLFHNASIIDVFSGHDYLFVESGTRDVIRNILHIRG